MKGNRHIVCFAPSHTVQCDDMCERVDMLLFNSFQTTHIYKQRLQVEVARSCVDRKCTHTHTCLRALVGHRNEYSTGSDFRMGCTVHTGLNLYRTMPISGTAIACATTYPISPRMHELPRTCISQSIAE